MQVLIMLSRLDSQSTGLEKEEQKNGPPLSWKFQQFYIMNILLNKLY